MSCAASSLWSIPACSSSPGVRTGALGIVALFLVVFGFFYIDAQYLQDVKGYSALLTGVCILPIAVVVPYASARSTSLAQRIGSRATTIIGLLLLAGAIAALSFATAPTPYTLYAVLLAVAGTGMGLAMPPLSGTIVHALPPTHAGLGAGLNSTTREFGSALGVAVPSTVLTSRFASHLPTAVRDLPGGHAQAVEHSITAALNHANSIADPDVRTHLLHATHAAFTSGTSLGLRIGVALLLLTTIAVALQHPNRLKEAA